MDHIKVALTRGRLGVIVGRIVSTIVGFETGALAALRGVLVCHAVSYVGHGH